MVFFPVDESDDSIIPDGSENNLSGFTYSKSTIETLKQGVKYV